MYLRLTNVCFETSLTSMILVYVEILILVSFTLVVFKHIKNSFFLNPICENENKNEEVLLDDIEEQNINLHINTFS